MTKNTATTQQGDDQQGHVVTRNRAVLLALAIAVAAGLGIVWAIGSNENPSQEATSTDEPFQEATSSSTSAPVPPQDSPTPTPSVEGAPTDLPVPLEPVPLDETAEFGDEVSAELVDLLAIQAEGQGAGEISGPAIRVTVQLSNGTGQPLPLDAVTVALYFGPDLIPAPTISDPEADPFGGSLGSGESARGVYTFSIAEEDRDEITVTVSHSPASAIVVFNGAF